MLPSKLQVVLQSTLPQFNAPEAEAEVTIEYAFVQVVPQSTLQVGLQSTLQVMLQSTLPSTLPKAGAEVTIEDALIKPHGRTCV